MLLESVLSRAEKLTERAKPGPWEWQDKRHKKSCNVVYTEPHKDGPITRGPTFDLICRDGGIAGPDVETCEAIMAWRALIVALLSLARAAEAACDPTRKPTPYWSALDELKHILFQLAETKIP